MRVKTAQEKENNRCLQTVDPGGRKMERLNPPLALLQHSFIARFVMIVSD